MSMLLPPFELHRPTTVAEAVKLKAAHPDSDWVAGGTDLLPNYKWMLNTRPHLVSLDRVEGLRDVTPTRIGAMATLTRIAEDPELSKKVPVVSRTAALIASPLLRNSGTLGGNLLLENRCFFFNQSYPWRESIDFCLKADGKACHVVPQESKCYATFSADLPGALIPLQAEVELAGPKGARRIPLRALYNNDGIARFSKRPDELVVAVHLPEHASEYRASYQKLRQRDSWDFPELGIGVALRFKKGALEEFHLCANALECAPKVLDGLGEAHLGTPLTDEAVEEISAAVEQNVRPVKNTSLSPSYRKKMSRVFAKRALLEARSAGALPRPRGSG